MRGFLVGLVVVLGIVLLPLADLAVWVERELLDTASFTRLADDVLDEPDVRIALADQVARRLVERFPDLRGSEVDLRRSAALVAKSDAFRVVFDDAVGRMHGQLVDREDRLSLDLDAMVPLVRDRLPPDVAARIPRPAGLADLEVVRRDDLPLLWNGVRVAQRAAIVFPIVSIVLLAAAILLARRRGVTTAIIGGAAAVVLLAVVVLMQFGRSVLESFSGDEVQRRAFDAAAGTVAGSFVRQTVLLAGGALVVAGIGIVSTFVFRATERSSEWA